MTTFAQRVKRARKAAGLTQRALERKFGIPQAIISLIESGEIKDSRYNAALEKALGLPASVDSVKTIAPAVAYLPLEAELINRNKALTVLCEEQQAKIEALLADNATLAEAKGKLAEELEALRDENIALVKEAINASTDKNRETFLDLVGDLQYLMRIAFVTGISGVESKTLQAVINHHTVKANG
jgi:transcriptional regulator with XRE-family HTH domain